MENANLFAESARVRAESQRIRVQAVRLRIAAVHTFCSVVENEARWESRQKAQDSMGKVWHAIAELKRHLAEPRHISDERAGELLDLLASVEDRAVRIHQALWGLASGSAPGHFSAMRRPAPDEGDPQTS